MSIHPFSPRPPGIALQDGKTKKPAIKIMTLVDEMTARIESKQKTVIPELIDRHVDLIRGDWSLTL